MLISMFREAQLQRAFVYTGMTSRQLLEALYLWSFPRNERTHAQILEKAQRRQNV